MPAEYNPNIPPPPLPSLTISDLIWQGYGDINDYFPQNGQGQAIVAPYLDEVDRLNDLLETNETDLRDTLDTLDQLLPQILDNAGFVPSDDFQQKVSELETESLQSPQDLAKMLQLAQEALAMYDALSDAERLEEAWNKAWESFQEAQSAIHNSQPLFEQAKVDMQAFQDLFDQLETSPNLGEQDWLRYQGFAEDAGIYQQILDLYINPPSNGNFNDNELVLYWELARNARNQFFGRNDPHLSSNDPSWSIVADKVTGIDQRFVSYTMVEDDKKDLAHATQKLNDFLERATKLSFTLGLSTPPDQDWITQAEKDLDSIQLRQKHYNISEDRLDSLKLLNDATPDLSSFSTQYKDASLMGLNQLYPSNGNLSFNDIIQGKLGDCFYLAAIAAIINKDDNLIKNIIQDNGDGTYQVTLHMLGVVQVNNIQGEPILKRTNDPSERNPISITVKPTFPVNGQGNLTGNNSNNSNSGYWILILEKALAQAMGGYDNIDEGGSSGEALSILTNQAHTSFDWADATGSDAVDGLAKLKDQITQGKMITVGSAGSHLISNFTLSPGKTLPMGVTALLLESQHACAVMGYDATTQKFQLYNPHGWLFEVDEADFTTFFSGFSVLD